MKKLSLAAIGMFVSILAAFSQNGDDSAYKSRKLKFEEANFVSSYYRQDGDHAAVTGGVGSEKLTDLSNTIDLTISGYDKRYRKHSLIFEAGVDHYTSASSDQIDPHSISSASHADTRFYPSLNWTMENEKKGTTVGAGLSYSTEFDYQSIGANINFAQKTRNKNGELSAKLQAYFDQVSLIYPIELRTSNGGGGREGDDYASTGRNSFSGSLSWSQIVNERLQVSVEGELIYQDGYLGLPFHRVYFNDATVHVEALPSTRLKIPLGVRANYFVGDKFILRSWYRNYHDDWGINSNAVQLETVVKLTPFFSITPFYRFYQQSAAKYFAPYEEHTANDEFFTSNYDLSKFNSNFFGAGFRVAPPNGVLNMQHVNALELRFGHYQRTDGLNSNIISLSLKF
ncbi:MAG TPA: DUF3570 domain-containing protein, partial [Parafilimonas sp.]|nr:DUF3570 domain-containing protein [Parafilimonas sp.]